MTVPQDALPSNLHNCELQPEFSASAERPTAADAADMCDGPDAAEPAEAELDSFREESIISTPATATPDQHCSQSLPVMGTATGHSSCAAATNSNNQSSMPISALPDPLPHGDMPSTLGAADALPGPSADLGAQEAGKATAVDCQPEHQAAGACSVVEHEPPSAVQDSGEVQVLFCEHVALCLSCAGRLFKLESSIMSVTATACQ